jgi:hypothetical protein
MDEFSVYDDTFKEALNNLEKVLIVCQEDFLTLSNEKFRILSKEGIILRNHISSVGIKVYLTIIKVIMDLQAPRSQKYVRSFLGHVSYYRRFIENFTKIATPMFKLLIKDIDFVWDSQCQNTFEELK